MRARDADQSVEILARYPETRRWRLSVDDYHRMGEAGILTEDDRVELICGELVEMAPIGSDHSGTVNSLTRMLVLALADRAILAPGNPVRLGRFSEPQPDFTVLRPRADYYRKATPTAEDVLLAIEIAHSSLTYDRGAKLALYAASGIREVWIVNLVDKLIEIHRQPVDDRYEVSLSVDRRGNVDIEALPGISFQGADILG